jgi:hypothetical protein
MVAADPSWTGEIIVPIRYTKQRFGWSPHRASVHVDNPIGNLLYASSEELTTNL